jgi:hypothetical protein
MPVSLEAIRQDVGRELGKGSGAHRALGELMRLRDRQQRGGMAPGERLDEMRKFSSLADETQYQLRNSGMPRAADHLAATSDDLIMEWRADRRSAVPEPNYGDMSGGRRADPDTEFTGWL